MTEPQLEIILKIHWPQSDFLFSRLATPRTFPISFKYPCLNTRTMTEIWFIVVSSGFWKLLHYNNSSLWWGVRDSSIKLHWEMGMHRYGCQKCIKLQCCMGNTFWENILYKNLTRSGHQRGRRWKSERNMYTYSSHSQANNEYSTQTVMTTPYKGMFIL